MPKLIIPAAIARIVIVAIIIGLVMMNTHPSLAEIVENKDCQELGKFDQRMDEIYGYDVKKAKANENISDELFSKARSLGIDCAFDAVKSMHSDNTSDEYDSKSASEIKFEAAEIIKERDCKQFVEWYKNNIDHVGVLDSTRDMVDIMSHNWECEIQNFVDEFKESNPSDLDPTEAVHNLYYILQDERCKNYDSWIKKYEEDFDYVKDKLIEEYSSSYKRCKLFQ